MKKMAICLGCVVFATAALAAVKPGENLLVNGDFATAPAGFPEFWSPSPANQVQYLPKGGPKGAMAAVTLRGNGANSGTVSLRQQGLALVAGETYRLSAYIKTKGFKSNHAGMIIHNAGWIKDVGFRDLPENSDWTFREKTFTLFASRNKEYGLAVFGVDMNGEIDVAALKLEAVSPGALAGSSSQFALVAKPRLIPLRPLLQQIPRDRPALTFRLCGLLPEKKAGLECRFRIDGDPIPPRAIAVADADGDLRLDLAGLPCGSYSLRAMLHQQQNGETLIEAVFPIRVIERPVVDRRGIRQLNNLVAELLDQPLKASPAPQSFTFVNPRDGWIFAACVSAGAPAADLKIAIDDGKPIITATTDRLEAFRALAGGAHRITVSGKRAAGTRLVVRSIPEILDYPPCTNSYVRGNGDYDWAFMKKHILPAVTTLNGGKLPGKALGEAKARGLRWLANFNVAPMTDADDIRQRLEQASGMTQPQYDGVTCDELFFGRATIDNYTRALWNLRNPQNRLVYTWIVGKPSICALHTDFMSAVLNASGGRGRLIFEAYCHPKADEKAAAAYLENYLDETMRQFNAYFPDAAAGAGMIFGNFTQIPIISLDHDPAVDFKYFLDMQVNRIANSPAFRKLAVTGYWGTYYGDEEMVRWSFKLMRHYAVEGKRDMLSKQYGFRYKPGLLQNGDFADGLKGWQVAPAKGNAIHAQTIPGYGKNSQGRWGAGKAGDTVCVMTRTPDKANRISQVAHGLTPGKTYCLQFVTGDLDDITGKTYHPRRYGIDVELPGADILPERSFVHIDRRHSGRYKHNNNVAKINLVRVVFRAKAPTLTITFHDTKARPGENLVLNFVQLKPYFLE